MEKLFITFCYGALGGLFCSVILSVIEFICGLIFPSDHDDKKSDFWVRSLFIMFLAGVISVVFKEYYGFP